MADLACGTGGFITSWLKALDKEVLVEHTEEPAARTEDKALVWELACAPRKSVAIRHGVKVTAPEKKDLSPSAP